MGEHLVLYAGAMGTSWRIPDHPLVVAASSLVTINLDLFPGLEVQP